MSRIKKNSCHILHAHQKLIEKLQNLMPSKAPEIKKKK